MFSSMLAMASGASQPPEKPPVKPQRPTEQAAKPTETSKRSKPGASTDKRIAPLQGRSSTAPSSGYSKAVPTSHSTPKQVPQQPLRNSTASKDSRLNTGAKGKIEKRTASPIANGGATAAKKKISFTDIMKKAEAVDTSKLKVTVQTKEKSAQTPRKAASAAAKSVLAGANSHSAMPTRQGTMSPRSKSASPSRSHTPLHDSPSKRSAPAPLPAARPFPELQAKLKNKRRVRNEEDDSDLDGFVVEDEDEDEEDGCERSYKDEIWGMFNRRGRDTYHDSDSDDMEATGADILAEEQFSRRQAAREDEREERALEEHARQKALRKKRRT